MKLKLQSGSILKKHGAWHWRYYEDGKQKSVKLAEVSNEHRSKQDVIPIANGMAVRMVRRAISPEQETSPFCNLRNTSIYRGRNRNADPRRITAI